MAVSNEASVGPGGCRVCGSAQSETLQAQGANFSRCARCGTLQRELTEEQFQSIDFTYDPGEYLDENDPAAIRAFLKVDEKIALLKRLAPHAVARGGRFLDIGCGMGGYLLAARELGFEVLGFEPSTNHAGVAGGKLDLPVVQDYFSAASVVGQHFDLVMLSHVIEHIYNPRAFIGEVLSVVAPGGSLLLLTPNANSFAARILGGAWPMLAPADHVTMLTPAAMRLLVDQPNQSWVGTMEYAHEFATAVLGGLKRRFSSSGTAPATAQRADRPPVMQRAGRASGIVRGALAVVSAPFHLAARACDRTACITFVVRRPG